MSPPASWEALAGEMLRRRIILEQTAPAIYPLQPFGYRASEADLASATTRLGHPLDTQHAELLKRVNGWPDIFANADLLGTGDLGQGERWARASQVLAACYEEGPATGFPPRGSIYPIHLAEDSVFVIDMSGPVTEGGHPVHWLSGELLGTWENVYEFWLAGFTLLERTTSYAIARVRAEGAQSN